MSLGNPTLREKTEYMKDKKNTVIRHSERWTESQNKSQPSRLHMIRDFTQSTSVHATPAKQAKRDSYRTDYRRRANNIISGCRMARLRTHATNYLRIPRRREKVQRPPKRGIALTNHCRGLCSCGSSIPQKHYCVALQKSGNKVGGPSLTDMTGEAAPTLGAAITSKAQPANRE